MNSMGKDIARREDRDVKNLFTQPKKHQKSHQHGRGLVASCASTDSRKGGIRNTAGYQENSNMAAVIVPDAYVENWLAQTEEVQTLIYSGARRKTQGMTL
jgi:hypothetical protein